MNFDQVRSHELEDDLYFLVNRRQPQFFGKIKDELNFMAKWNAASILR